RHLRVFVDDEDAAGAHDAVADRSPVVREDGAQIQDIKGPACFGIELIGGASAEWQGGPIAEHGEGGTFANPGCLPDRYEMLAQVGPAWLPAGAGVQGSIDHFLELLLIGRLAWNQFFSPKAQ